MMKPDDPVRSTPKSGLAHCLRCLLTEYDPKLAASVLAHIDNLPGRLKATPETVAARLGKCRGCPDLVNGTCMQCGCYVEIRAAVKKSRCPKRIW